MKLRLIFLAISAVLLCSCSKNVQSVPQTIRIVSWGGIGAAKADTLFSLAKECGFDTHLGLYSTQENAALSMDAAARAGVGIIINFPQLKDSTESAVSLIKDHPALVAYHIKDEPELDDFEWLKALHTKISSLDAEHPCYMNLLPNWSWGVEEYRDNIERFASEFDVPFYSFDNYPIVEKDGEVEVRPDWYRNLEEFSAMARSHGKPFWAFALAKAHSITEPQVAVYPEPTIGHLRLQVFSNLLYGAQAIQYFNFTGIVDHATCEKKPSFDLIRQVNSEVRAYSPVFAGCTVLDVWHTGESIPSGTVSLAAMPDGLPHERVKSLRISGEGAVVSLLEHGGESYLAVQNRSCLEAAVLDITFDGRVSLLTLDGSGPFSGQPIHLEPGCVAVFRL